jgi:hypothetical protein
MRTTLGIGDDVLIAAKAIARSEGKTVGDVITELARRSLRKEVRQEDEDAIPRLPMSRPDAVVTLEIVNALRDEAP